MAFRMHDRKVYAALESVTEGTAVTPNASTGYIETIDPTFSITAATFERNPTRGSITPVPQTVPGTGIAAGAACATVEFTFSVELAGTGTAATAPRWGMLLKACGFEELTTLKSAPIGVTDGSTTQPRNLRHREAISAQAGTSFSSGDRVGRVVGDVGYDDGTVYFVKAGSSTTVAASDNIVGQASANRAVASDVEAASGVAYALVSGTELGGSTSTSLTLRVAIDSTGKFVEGVGCRGNVEFVFVANDRVLLNFTFTGRLNQYSDGATTLTPTADTMSIPPAFNGVSLALRESTYGAGDGSAVTSSIFNSMSINIGNEVTLRESVSAGSGYDVAYITGRAPSMTFNPDAVAESTYGFWDRFLSGELTRAKMTVGDTSGNQFLFKMPAIQFSGISDGNRDEVMILDSSTTLTGGDTGSSIQESAADTGANSTVTNARLGTNNEFVFFQI